MSKFRLEVMCILSMGISIAIAGSAIAQQTYPSKPIRMIVPFPPGGSTDPLARMVTQKLAERWGQPVLVENRAGANGIIGTDTVAKAAPDGYTFVVVGSPHVVNPLLIATLPYDAMKDFEAVATLVSARHVLVLNPSVPANTLQEFIALAKSKPGQLNFSSSGSGNSNHLAGESFNMTTGVRLQHVPYKGAGPAITDLISGQVQLSFQVPISVISHIKSGKLKAIAISGETRSSVLPQVPTFSEAGVPGFELAGWLGILAPAGTPKGIVEKMSAEIGKILVISDIKDKLDSQGMDVLVSTPEQFAALMKADTVRYAKIIKTANIKIEN